MNTVGFNLATSNLGENLTAIGKSEISLNQRQLVTDILHGLNGCYFETNNSTIKEFAGLYGDLRLPEQSVNASTTGTIDLVALELYNDAQLALVQPFVDQLLSTEDVTSAKLLAIEFQQKVTLSSLIEDEKLGLLVVSTSVIGLAEFMENGGIEEIQSILASNLDIEGSINGRFQGCSVNTRSVMAGAVASGVIGGGFGLKAGCSGGMIGGLSEPHQVV